MFSAEPSPWAVAQNHAAISVVFTVSFVTPIASLQDSDPTSAGNVDAVEVEPCSMYVTKMNGKYYGRAFRQEGKLLNVLSKMQTAFSASSNSANELSQKNQMKLK